MKYADIVSIGDELLIGQVVNTNASWMAALLSEAGIAVKQISTVSDSKAAIADTLTDSIKRSDIVLITGGLGPTKDDITKYTLAEYFGCNSWVIHQPTLSHIEEILGKRGVPVSQLNREQAKVPECCKVIANSKGTAPGMWFEKDGKVVVSMPGVPFEMKVVMEQLLPMLKQHFTLDDIFHKTMLTYGIPESVLAEKIEAWENTLPSHLHLAYLPSPESGVRLRLSAYGGDGDALRREIDQQFFKLKPILGNSIYGWNTASLESVVGELLKAKNQTVSTAESCTGGKIASLLTRIPGSSAYYKGSIVAYSNEVKEAFLGVKQEVLAAVGAVSQEVVEQMATGVRDGLKTDFAVATSGIAGPGGGTSEKPAGTVWIAVATPHGVFSQKHFFTLDRELVITRASAVALNMLRMAIIG